MIKGLAITPPLLGRISIGRVIEKNGKRLPEKDDQFTITTQMVGQGGWIPHPIDQELRKGKQEGKLRAIPVRLLFNEPELNLRAEYTMFNRQSGRPTCVGNGEVCKRVTDKGVESLPCPSPALCTLGQGGNCKPYGRLNVKIGEDDALGTFMFRTTGFNSIRSLAARLSYYQAVSGNLLACMPLELKLRGKTAMNQFRAPIYYVDLTTREGQTLEQAIQEAKQLHLQRQQSGYQQEALDASARMGFANAAFEFTEEELPEILEEFYPEATHPEAPQEQEEPLSIPVSGKTLKGKLGEKVEAMQ